MRHTDRLRHIILFSLVTLLLTLTTVSCGSVDKFIQPDQRVLNRNKFQVTMADSSEVPPEIKGALKDMDKYVKQKPNSHVLGFGPRVSMRIYCLSNPEKDNFWHNYLRRKGQAPVVYDENLTAQTCSQLQGLLNAKGCFSSEVSFDTVWKHRRDVNVVYIISPKPRYHIYNVSFHAETPQVDSLLRIWKKESLLHPGDYYDQEVMAKERTRLAEKLRSSGYWLASPDLITYTVDSSYQDNKLSIRLDIHNVQTSEGSRPLQVYRIDQIYVYPNAPASSTGTQLAFDTLVTQMQFRTVHTEYKYLFDRPMSLKPRVINRTLMFYNNQVFRPRTVERTYNSLLGLHTFKYINIDLAESPNSCDSNRLLNVRIRLMNAKKQRLSLSVEINNSSPISENSGNSISGNFGLETKLSYHNKNLFGGAEMLKTEWSLLVELPKLIFKDQSDQMRNNVSSFENGLNISLDIPTFLFPFTESLLWQRIRPHTLFTLGTNYQLHSYFDRLLLNTGYGYNWNRRNNQHQLMPLELTYVRFFNIDSAFLNRMARTGDARLQYQYSDHFIMDARYDYILNTQQYGTRNNFNYIHLSVETAGNVLNLINKISGGKSDQNGVMQLYGVPFSQYVRLSAELKRYFYIWQRSTLVARMLTGIGIPYGNSYAMPYEKSFFGGGPTTIRAWHLRQLGPGNYHTDAAYSFERIGDIQLVGNIEYRFPLISILEGALFVDAGNVWLARESDEFPGGKFKFKQLPQSIAAGIGMGLRANISIVTVRCDLAIPLYDPGMLHDERLRISHWNFSQISANFGIDYPF